MIRTISIRVLKVGRMSWRGVGYVTAEGKGKGTRDVDKFEI